MHFCSQCGSQLIDGARFCASCGASVNVSTNPVPLPAQPTQPAQFNPVPLPAQPDAIPAPMQPQQPGIVPLPVQSAKKLSKRAMAIIITAIVAVVLVIAGVCVWSASAAAIKLDGYYSASVSEDSMEYSVQVSEDTLSLPTIPTTTCKTRSWALLARAGRQAPTRSTTSLIFISTGMAKTSVLQSSSEWIHHL